MRAKHKTATNTDTKDEQKKKKLISNRMYGLGNTRPKCARPLATPAILKCNNKNFARFSVVNVFLVLFRVFVCGPALPASARPHLCRSADSFSFMHNCCTYWQLVYLNVTQTGALHKYVCICVCVCADVVVVCMCLSLLRKVPFKRKYRHCSKLSPTAKQRMKDECEGERERERQVEG